MKLMEYSSAMFCTNKQKVVVMLVKQDGLGSFLNSLQHIVHLDTAAICLYIVCAAITEQ